MMAKAFVLIALLMAVGPFAAFGVEGEDNPIRSYGLGAGRDGAISPDGSLVVTVAMQNAVLWDAATGERLHIIHADRNGLNSVAFSEDGALLALGSGRSSVGGTYVRKIQLWEVESRQLIRTIWMDSEAAGNLVDDLAFSPDGSRILGAAGGTAHFFDVTSGGEIWRFQNKGGALSNFTQAAFSPDGSHVLTGCVKDTAARLWEISTRKEVQSFDGHVDGVMRLAFSPDGLHIATAGTKGGIRLWNATTGRLVRSLSGSGTIAFSADGVQLLAGDATGMRSWNVATGSTVRSFGWQGTCWAFASDGTLGLTAAGLWDVKSGARFIHFRHEADSFYFWDGASLAVSRDGSKILASKPPPIAWGNGETVLWDAVSGEELRRFVSSDYDAPLVAISPDGTRALSGSETLVRMWDTATGAVIPEFSITGRLFLSLAFSPDGTMVLTGGRYTPASLWDSSTGEHIRTLGSTNRSESVGFSPDGAFAMVSGSQIELVEIATGEIVQTLPSSYGIATLSPDGTMVLAEDGQLWDVETGKLIRRLPGRSFASIAFSPDGTRAVTTDDSYYPSSARLWDLSTGAEIRRYQNNFGIIFRAVFLSEGTEVLTGFSPTDLRALVWSATAPAAPPAPFPTGELSLSSTWSFAEGSTLPAFETFFLIANPHGEQLEVKVEYLPESGAPKTRTLYVPGHGRYTLHANGDIPNQGLGATFVAPSGRGFAVERAMYARRSGGYWVGAHSSVGIPEAKSEWFLAEGATSMAGPAGKPFQTFVLLANSNDTATTVGLTFYPEGGDAFSKSYVVPAKSRRTLEPGKEDERLASTAFSTRVVEEGGLGILVERAMWWNSTGWPSSSNYPFMEGTASPGIAELSKHWYLAEGNTNGHDEFLLLVNPSDVSADVTIRYFLEDAPPIQRSLVVGANQRMTINARSGSKGLGIGLRHGTMVTASVPVAVERSVYFSRGSYGWVGAHNTIGSATLSNKWLLPEGATVNVAGSQMRTEVLLANPNPVPVKAEVRFLLQGEGYRSEFVSIGPERRMTVVANDNPDLQGRAFSTLVLADGPIVVERSMYFDGVVSPTTISPIGATNSLGIPAGELIALPIGVENEASAATGEETNHWMLYSPTPTLTPTPTPALDESWR